MLLFKSIEIWTHLPFSLARLQLDKDCQFEEPKIPIDWSTRHRHVRSALALFFRKKEMRYVTLGSPCSSVPSNRHSNAQSLSKYCTFNILRVSRTQNSFQRNWKRHDTYCTIRYTLHIAGRQVGRQTGSSIWKGAPVDWWDIGSHSHPRRMLKREPEFERRLAAGDATTGRPALYWVQVTWK